MCLVTLMPAIGCCTYCISPLLWEVLCGELSIAQRKGGPLIAGNNRELEPPLMIRYQFTV